MRRTLTAGPRQPATTMVTDSPRPTALPWLFSIAAIVTAIFGPPMGVLAALHHLNAGLQCESLWPGLVAAGFLILITPSIISTTIAFAGLITARTRNKPAPVPVITTVAVVLAGSVLVLVAIGGGLVGSAMILLRQGMSC